MSAIFTGGFFWRQHPGSGNDARHLVLAQGWTASGAAQALGRDLRTIGRWAAALIFEQTPEVPARPWRDAAGGVEGGGAGTVCHGCGRTRQLELKGSSSVCLGAIRHQPETQWLPELSALVGICAEASQEPIGQGRRKEEGVFRSGVRRPDGGSAGVRSQDSLCLRGSFPGGYRASGQVGTEGLTGVGRVRSLRRSEKASYYSAVCLTTREIEWMELEETNSIIRRVAAELVE